MHMERIRLFFNYDLFHYFIRFLLFKLTIARCSCTPHSHTQRDGNLYDFYWSAFFTAQLPIHQNIQSEWCNVTGIKSYDNEHLYSCSIYGMAKRAWNKMNTNHTKSAHKKHTHTKKSSNRCDGIVLPYKIHNAIQLIHGLSLYNSFNGIGVLLKHRRGLTRLFFFVLFALFVLFLIGCWAKWTHQS